MSAWMISDAHIDLLTTAYLRLCNPEVDPQAVGRQFADDCAASIRARYADRHGCAAAAEQQAADYQYKPWSNVIDPWLLATEIACYDYQSCETEDWKTRPSYVACEALNEKLKEQGVDWEKQPRGVEHMPWGVDENHRALGPQAFA